MRNVNEVKQNVAIKVMSFYLTDEECKCCRWRAVLATHESFYLTDEECKLRKTLLFSISFLCFYLTDEECKYSGYGCMRDDCKVFI